MKQVQPLKMFGIQYMDTEDLFLWVIDSQPINDQEWILEALEFDESISARDGLGRTRAGRAVGARVSGSGHGGHRP